MTMQMMKTTASTGPTTQIRPSPASWGWGSESGAITGSVYGLATYIFCKYTNRHLFRKGISCTRFKQNAAYKGRIHSSFQSHSFLQSKNHIAVGL